MKSTEHASGEPNLRFNFSAAVDSVRFFSLVLFLFWRGGGSGREEKNAPRIVICADVLVSCTVALPFRPFVYARVSQRSPYTASSRQNARESRPWPIIASRGVHTASPAHFETTLEKNEATTDRRPLRPGMAADDVRVKTTQL